MPFSRIVSRLSIRGMDGWMDGWMDLKKKRNDIIHRPIVIFFLFFLIIYPSNRGWNINWSEGKKRTAEKKGREKKKKVFRWKNICQRFIYWFILKNNTRKRVLVFSRPSMSRSLSLSLPTWTAYSFRAAFIRPVVYIIFPDRIFENAKDQQ